MVETTKSGIYNGYKIIGTQTLGLRGLVLWLKLNEGSGNIAYDSSFYHNDGTIYGATWVDGKFGKALYFDGVDDRVIVLDSPNLDFTHKSITIAMWVKTTHTSGGWHYLLHKDAGDCNLGTRGVVLTYRYGSPKITSGDCSVLSGNNINDGEWHFVVGQVRDNGDGTATQKIFVDGVLNNERTGSNLRIENDSKNIQCPHVYFEGIIDEVMIFNRALSEDEIKLLYHHRVGAVSGKAI